MSTNWHIPYFNKYLSSIPHLYKSIRFMSDNDDNLVIICYSAKHYAQSTTTVLSTPGYDMTFILHPQFMSVSQR